MNEIMQYRLVIADDHPLFRGALREAAPPERAALHLPVRLGDAVRRHRLALGLAVALLCAAAVGRADGPVGAVGAIGLTVSDLDAAVRFYTEVLGFKKTDVVEVAGDAAERLEGVFPVRARVRASLESTPDR